MRNQTGSNNPNWKGGKVRHIKGYIYAYAPWHPKNHNGYVLEHRLVAEKKLGRFLYPWEIAHHINGDKTDNEPENIEVKHHIQHNKEHYLKNPPKRDERGRFIKEVTL